MTSGDQSGLPDLEYALFEPEVLRKILKFYDGNPLALYNCCKTPMQPFTGGFFCSKCESVQNWITRTTYRKAMEER